MHFRLKFPFISKTTYEIGTDPVNIKHPVARASQHQLSLLYRTGLLAAMYSTVLAHSVKLNVDSSTRRSRTISPACICVPLVCYVISLFVIIFIPFISSNQPFTKSPESHQVSMAESRL